MTGDDVSKLLDDLRLRASDLATVLGVDRATTYRWLQKGEQDFRIGAWQEELLSVLFAVAEDEEMRGAWLEIRMDVLRAGWRGELARGVHMVLGLVYGEEE